MRIFTIAYKVKAHRIAFIMLMLLANCGLLSQNKLVNYINPMVGTGGAGHTFPGSVVPFAMVQLSPDTRIDGSWEGCSGYHYSDDTIYGFSHTHLSGTGCSDLGDVAFMPNYAKDKNDVATNHDSVFSTFNHANEKASAGYYKVLLDNGIRVELTSTLRTGLQKYTFTKAGYVWITLNLKHRDVLLEGKINRISPIQYSGLRRSKAWAQNQLLFFAFELNKSPEDAIITQAENGDTRIDFYYNVKAGEELLIKTGLSNTGENGALKNLKTEQPAWDFEGVKKAAENAWEQKLNKIEVFGGQETDKYKFYTALYHCMIHPSVLSDADSTYRGRDNLIHKADWGHYYTIFSLWDTYRALHPLLNIIEPKISRDFIKTFQAQYEQCGRLPKWELWGNETECMIGLHSIPVILDAYTQGVINQNDLKAIYPAVVAECMSDRESLPVFRNKGYLESNDCAESVSKTLEYSFDFFCANQIKQYADMSASKTPDLRTASFGFVNLWDSELKLMRPRKNGNWITPFDPKEINNHFTEGNSWQYSLYFPHNLVNSFKITDTVVNRIFKEDSKTTGRTQADVTGLIGQYAHGNEPSHHIPYLLSQENSKKIISKICSELYANTPEGLCGNDDCGQMSAWYVFSAMGFYPVCPGKNEYFWGEMLFDSVNIKPIEAKIYKYFKPEFNFRRIEILPNSRIRNSHIDSILILDTLNYYKSNVFNLNNSKIYISNYDKKGIGTSHILRNRQEIYAAPLVVQNKHGIELIPLKALSVYDFPSKYDPNGSLVLNEFNNSETTVVVSTTKPYEIAQISNSADLSSDTLKFKTIPKYKLDSAINSRLFDNSYSFTSYFINYAKKYPDVILNLHSKYNKQYSADGDSGIIDGHYGQTDWRLGGWQGYQSQNFECEMNLKKKKTIQNISFSCLQDTRSWILFPKSVMVYGSNNGNDYILLGGATNYIADTSMTVQTQKIKVSLPSKKKYKFIKIVAENYGKLPIWHPGKGEDAFIFVDEVTVE